jgi:hypothetical protein
MSVAALLKEVQALKLANRASELDARKSKIDVEIAKYTPKAVKRTLRHNLESLDIVKDLDGVWEELADQAEDGVVATAENLDEINEAIAKQTGVVKKLRDHLLHESRMQVASVTSALGWLAVEQLELGKVAAPVHILDSKELRTAEKERMAYDGEFWPCFLFTLVQRI